MPTLRFHVGLRDVLPACAKQVLELFLPSHFFKTISTPKDYITIKKYNNPKITSRTVFRSDARVLFLFYI
jgi:hypothetical protein